MEDKTKEQIIKEEFERAERCGEHIKDVKDLVVFMHEEIEFYRKKINLLGRELDDLSKGLQKENDELTEKVQELETELTDAGTVIENKARSEKRLNDAIIAKNIQIEELKINNRDLGEKLRDEQELSERCRIEKAAALKSNSDLVHKVRDLEEDLATAKERIEELESEQCMTEGDLEDAREDAKKLKNALQRAEYEILKMKADKQTEHDREKSGLEELLRQKIEVKELKESNAGQAELIRKLKEELEKQTERAERAEAEIREMKTIGEIEHGTLYADDETVITINRKPQEILSVSILFANNEGGEDDEED